MGSVSLKIGDGTARFRRSSLCYSAMNMLMLFSVVTTNLFALYAFTSSPSPRSPHLAHRNISLLSHHVALILREIDSSQRKLARIEKNLLGYDAIDPARPDLPAELRAFLRPHHLPLGRDSRTGITDMVASVGHPCHKSLDLLSGFMSYKLSGPCPDDWSVGQKLILRGCEPLPRRRCFVKSIPKLNLHPFPKSLWKPVNDTAVSWASLGCKNFRCLIGKKLSRDCVNCFDLGSEYNSQKFVRARNKHDFVVDDVLALGSGGIRLGFDIGGGAGTFASRMSERNVTVITAALNINAPYSEFIAARGLFPVFLSLNHRFPFHDNVFDIIRAGSGLDLHGQQEKLEFLMFDIDRILRAGGLFWLDNFFCATGEKKMAVTRLFERFGYKKLKWVAGEKEDTAGSGLLELYLSAVLQKPIRV